MAPRTQLLAQKNKKGKEKIFELEPEAHEVPTEQSRQHQLFVRGWAKRDPLDLE